MWEVLILAFAFFLTTGAMFGYKRVARLFIVIETHEYGLGVTIGPIGIAVVILGFLNWIGSC